MASEALNPFQTLNTQKQHGFSKTLAAVRAKIEVSPEKLSLREVISYFGPKGHALLTLFFVLPFLQPIPIPGLSVVLGVCICFFGAFMFLNRAPWVPDRIARIRVEKKFLLRVLGALVSLLNRIETFVRPRHQTYFERRGISSFHGLLITWHAFLLALPLPIPFSNLLPGICIGLIAIGSLEEDIWVVVAGYAMALVNLAFFVALIVAPFVLGHAIHT